MTDTSNQWGCTDKTGFASDTPTTHSHMLSVINETIMWFAKNKITTFLVSFNISTSLHASVGRAFSLLVPCFSDASVGRASLLVTCFSDASVGRASLLVTCFSDASVGRASLLVTCFSDASVGRASLLVTCFSDASVGRAFSLLVTCFSDASVGRASLLVTCFSDASVSALKSHLAVSKFTSVVMHWYWSSHALVCLALDHITHSPRSYVTVHHEMSRKSPWAVWS